jgi:hypothetical protein
MIYLSLWCLLFAAAWLASEFESKSKWLRIALGFTGLAAAFFVGHEVALFIPREDINFRQAALRSINEHLQRGEVGQVETAIAKHDQELQATKDSYRASMVLIEELGKSHDADTPKP